jgi:hypothetical protein
VAIGYLWDLSLYTEPNLPGLPPDAHWLAIELGFILGSGDGSILCDHDESPVVEPEEIYLGQKFEDAYTSYTSRLRCWL